MHLQLSSCIPLTDSLSSRIYSAMHPQPPFSQYTIVYQTRDIHALEYAKVYNNSLYIIVQVNNKSNNTSNKI